MRGRIYKLSAPNTKHQEVSRNLVVSFAIFLKNKSCKVFSAPFDVRLPVKNKKKDNEVNTVVQPDICVICDVEKVDEKGCLGAPDLVIEILSPGNNKKELKNKYEVYEEAGVREYWIIHPAEQTFSKYILTDGRFQSSRMLTIGDEVTTDILPGFVLDLDELFEEKTS